MQKLYRDGLEEQIEGPVTVSHTRTGHTVEKYKVKGQDKYFVTLNGTHYCAHGTTVAQAVADALWKDPAKRPSLAKLKQKIQKAGHSRKISLREFQVLTGACDEGCRIALDRANVSGAPMTAMSIRDKVNKEWGNKLLDILGWNK